jgi:hypothetical protein
MQYVGAEISVKQTPAPSRNRPARNWPSVCEVVRMVVATMTVKLPDEDEVGSLEEKG